MRLLVAWRRSSPHAWSVETHMLFDQNGSLAVSRAAIWKVNASSGLNQDYDWRSEHMKASKSNIAWQGRVGGKAR